MLPRTTARRPSILMFAPMRTISSACMKRFSKIFSVMIDVPSACVASAMYCACMSVGKPGYSSVTMSAALMRIVAHHAHGVRRVARLDSDFVPAFRAARRDVRDRSPRHSDLRRSCAPAMMNVAASMRSGMILCFAPCSLLTPFTRMVEVPAPSICAPILFSRSARSATSGSRAQFCMTVSPSARVAAMSKSSVPVTVILSKTISPPLRRSALAST